MVRLATSKGMNRVALVELGSGCCHGDDSTKAAVRACNDAIEWNSVKVRTIIPGGYAGMQVHVHLGVPSPETVDLERVRACFPHGKLLSITLEAGGLLGSSRAGLPVDESPEALMTVANACVTVGFTVSEDDGMAAATQAQVEARRVPLSESAPSPLQPPSSAAWPTPAPMGNDDALSSEMSLLAERVLTPYEAFALLGDDDDVELYDVRPTNDRLALDGMSAQGAAPLPLDKIMRGELALPPVVGSGSMVLICPRGGYSAKALAFLAASRPNAVCVEGGVVAWEAYKLPVAPLSD